MKNSLKNKINNQYNFLHKKFLASKTIYWTTNISIIAMNVIFAILNIRAIQTNSDPSNPLKWVFLTIGIINILITFITGIKTLLALSNIIEKNNQKIMQLETIEKNQSNFSNAEIIDHLTEIDLEK
ncbi:hypothetical protein MCAV_01620 [[Mycoplasma] cavipharyngis]|uniref:hypothetical protein n=1 Tax=[Mycoplasma] cavipharyngis TaxID=92757 RepID=UPI0037038ACA